MAWKYMKRNLFKIGLRRQDEFDETLSSPGNSDWIILPQNIRSVPVALITSGGSGKIQYTHDNIATVKTGSPTVFDWDAGVVTANADDVLFPVTAIRLVNVSGTTQMVGSARK